MKARSLVVKNPISFTQVYKKLFTCYGPQHWWPGESPFEIMLGAILTQNTAWLNVVRAIDNLKANNCLSPQIILKTSSDQLAVWIKPSGYFNLKTKRLKNFCQWYVDVGELSALSLCETSSLRRQLLSVNGIGPETADDILLYAFERPVFVVDAYTRRFFSRLGLLDHDVGYEVLRDQFEANMETDTALFNEYHALIVRHVKDVCKKPPKCSGCCLNKMCSFYKL